MLFACKIKLFQTTTVTKRVLKISPGGPNNKRALFQFGPKSAQNLKVNENRLTMWLLVRVFDGLFSSRLIVSRLLGFFALPLWFAGRLLYKCIMKDWHRNTTTTTSNNTFSNAFMVIIVSKKASRHWSMATVQSSSHF